MPNSLKWCAASFLFGMAGLVCAIKGEAEIRKEVTIRRRDEEIWRETQTELGIKGSSSSPLSPQQPESSQTKPDSSTP